MQATDARAYRDIQAPGPFSPSRRGAWGRIGATGVMRSCHTPSIDWAERVAVQARLAICEATSRGAGA
jgi:hypothetical protein